jgi:hypothetical protein
MRFQPVGWALVLSALLAGTVAAAPELRDLAAQDPTHVTSACTGTTCTHTWSVGGGGLAEFSAFTAVYLSAFPDPCSHFNSNCNDCIDLGDFSKEAEAYITGATFSGSCP